VCNGVRLSWESFGAGEPVLLIAGTGMPPAGWQVGEFALAPALVDAGYRAVTFANRGIAPSQAPTVPYSVADMAADTAALVEALELAPCRIVGYSLGGQIAEEMCYRHPELVTDVVLMASAGRSTAFVRLYVQAQVDVAMAIDPPLPTQAARDTLLFTQPPSVLQREPETVDRIRSMIETAPPWTNPGRLGQWAAVHAWVNDEERPARWTGLTQRCLLVAFELDVAWPPSRVREAADAMPNAQYAEIAGAVHGGLVTRGEEVTKTILEFFASQSSLTS